MYQHDLDNPVRPASNHADKNLALRSYSSTSALQDFVLYGTDDPIRPPQFATLFQPDRVPYFSHVYRVNDWIWATSPNPGTRGSPITTYPVTALGLQTIPGEELQSPAHARDLGSPWGGGGAVVMFADADSVTLKFTREDSAATGYTLHIDNICPDPNLLSLYSSLDNADRNSIYNSAYGYNQPRDGVADYNLPGLAAGQVFGTARGEEIRIAIVDSGSFMDPRSRDEWWQIRPVTTAPLLVSPPNGASVATATPQLSWTAVSASSEYQVQVSSSSSFSSLEVNQTLNALTLTTPTLGDGTHYWRVRAHSTNGSWSAWSVVGSFMIDRTPPSVPSLISPANGSTVNNRAPVFDWSDATGAAQYQIQVDDSTSFSSPAIDVTVAASTYTPTIALANGTYNWRVRAGDAAGNWSGYSSARTVVISVPPLGVGHYEETNANLTYIGTWTTYSGAGPSGGSLKYTNTPAASVTFQITGGTGLKVYRQMTTNRGMMRVCVDTTCADVNNYSGTNLFQQAWTSAAFSTGLHAVTITNLETTKYLDLDAIDVLGPVTPLGVGHYEETNANLTYTGTWTTYSGAGPSGGSLKYTNTPAASVTFQITGGTGLKVYRQMTTNRGMMRVCVDTTCADVNNYSGTNLFQQAWTSAAFSTGLHTVTITNLETTKYLDLDAIDVLGPVTPLGVGHYEETNANLTYTGTWTTYSGAGPSGGSLKYTNTPAASVTFQITGGTGLKVYRQMTTNRGMMRVCIDTTCADVNNYSGTNLFQQAWTSAAFSTGLHAVTMTNLETTKYLDLDAIEVLP